MKSLNASEVQYYSTGPVDFDSYSDFSDHFFVIPIELAELIVFFNACNSLGEVKIIFRINTNKEKS